jgi:hypothetical protein
LITESPVNLALAQTIRQWLEEVYNAYLIHLEEGGAETAVTEQSEDWRSEEYARASSLTRCPKRHAAERAGYIEKAELSQQARYFFRLANLAAHDAKAAIKWGIENHAPPQWHFAAEFRMWADGLKLAGTPDVFITVDVPGQTAALALPCEIKKTDSDRYEGITPDQVWQTVAYMALAEAQGHNCPFGYVYTMYDGKGDKPSLRVWLIARTDEGWQLMDGFRPAQMGEQFPAKENGDNLFSQEAFLSMVKNHNSWYNWFSDDPTEAAGKQCLPDPFNRMCGNFTPPDFYKRAYNGYAKGDRKPGTGQITNMCPLFGRCWAHLLGGRQELPDVLDVGVDAEGNFRLGG